MNLRKLFILFLSLSSFTACGTEEKPSPVEISKPVQEDHSGHDHVTFDQSKDYAKNGVQFSVPEGWKYAEAPIPEVGVYIMVEKQGDNESGQFIASIINQKVVLSSYMEDMRAQLKQTFEMQNTEYSFNPIQSKDNNNQKTFSSSFEHKTGGLDFVGTMKTFHCNEKTVYLFTQEAISDASKNKLGFDVLQKTFKCL